MMLERVNQKHTATFLSLGSFLSMLWQKKPYKKGLTLAKFGGSSLADAACFKNIANIVKSDEKRRFIVVSAPGKRFLEDTKITDLLIKSLDEKSLAPEIEQRFLSISGELGLRLDFKRDFKALRRALLSGDRAFVMSRGEYLSAKIMAKLLNFSFIDAKWLIKFKADGSCDFERTRRKIKRTLKWHKNAVIPGFYGSDEQKRIRCFSRGGSDITGALLADALEADLYENWTDVSGVFDKNPVKNEGARRFNVLSYSKLLELAQNGAEVVHREAVQPLLRKKIKMQVKNSFAPTDFGSLVCERGDFYEW